MIDRKGWLASGGHNSSRQRGYFDKLLEAAAQRPSDDRDDPF